MISNSGTSSILVSSSWLVFSRVSRFNILTSAAIYGNSGLTAIVYEDSFEGTCGFTNHWLDLLIVELGVR